MSANMSDENKSDRNRAIIFREQVYLLYSVMLNSLIASVIIAVVLSFVQWDIINHSVLIVWLSLILGVTLFRFVLRFKFKRINNLSPEVIRKYYYLFLLGVLASGIIWGMASILLFTTHAVVNQVFLAFMIGGITAGAISSLSYRMAPIMIFLVSTLPPLAVRFFHTNTELSWIMGGMIGLYFILVAMNSRSIYKISYKNIILGLRVEDQRLLLKESNLRIKAEQDLRKSEKQLKSILDNSSTVVYVKDLECKYMLINKRFEELFHVTNELIRDKTDYDIFPKQMAYRFRENDLTAFNARKPVEFEEHAPLDDGIHTYISIKFCLYNNKNEPYAVCGISTDITERKQLEERLLQSEKMEALGTLAGGIAHEFNNLLAVILGNVQMCMTELPDDSKEMQYLFPILKVGKRATDLVKQILVFSRMEIVNQKPINLYPVVEDAIQMIRATIPTNIEIRKNIQGNHVNIMADTTQIHQVLLNLSINAYHAMEKTGGVLEISLEKAECDHCPLTHCTDKLKTGCLELTVRDTGHGISLEDQEKIFDPFFTTKEVGNGTGLGLAVVHGIVKNHQHKYSW